MSAGVFARSTYETDGGVVASIKVQPETIAATFTPGGANAAAGGTVTSPVAARATGGNRKYGIKARAVSFVFTGAVPDGYKSASTLRIPILTPAVYNAITTGSTGTYLGNAIQVIGKSPERVR